MSGSWRVDGKGTGWRGKSRPTECRRLPARTGTGPEGGTACDRGGLAVNGEVRLMSALIRPQVRLLVAERRERDGPVVVISPAGPLTWNELELVQGLGDPLTLADLLPEQPVAVGEHWRVRNSAAQALSEYDIVTSNSLDASLESADAAKARIRLKGQIQGSARGGPGKMICDGFLDVRSPGGPNRPPRFESRRKPAAGTGRGRAGYQEHAHRHATGGRAAAGPLRCRTGGCLAGNHPRA